MSVGAGNVFSFVNVGNSRALDGNETTCSDQDHPRTFLYDYNNAADNQRWRLVTITGSYYALQNVYTGRVLDGNTAVPNVDPSKPMPFTWPAASPMSSTPDNEQWFFTPVGTSTSIYYIRNKAGSQLSLDGNYTTATQPCPLYPSPYLFAPNSASLYQQWRLYPHP